MQHQIQFKSSILTIHYSVLIVSGLFPLFCYALKDDQPAPTESVRFRERNAPVEHRLSDEFNLETKKVKQLQAKPSVERHMSPKVGSEQESERKGDTSGVSKSCDLQDVPPLPPQKRSPGGSSVSDDSLSPPPAKVNYRYTQANEHRHKVSVCVCLYVSVCMFVCA